MKTRDMYNCIITHASWNAPVLVTDEAKHEIMFLKENVRKLNVPGRLTKTRHAMYKYIAMQALFGTVVI